MMHLLTLVLLTLLLPGDAAVSIRTSDSHYDASGNAREAFLPQRLSKGMLQQEPAAFEATAAVPGAVARRAATPSMQFFGKNNKKEPRKGNAIYDDEVDTTYNRFAFWKADDEDVGVEDSGFAEDGSDLATKGLGLYAAFIPFLLLLL